jgi:hypothetical protein
MDNQFNTLSQSYSSNYVQYKVTGNQKYKDSYDAAKQGLDSILSQLEGQVNKEKSDITAFYKSGVDQRISELQMKNRMLQRGISQTQDDLETAKLRSQSVPIPITPPTVSTYQYVALGVLGAALAGLLM